MAVIFDMDGVIVDTNPFHAKAFLKFFKNHHVEVNDDAFVQHMYGKHNSYIMRHFFGREIAPEEFVRLEEEKEVMFRTIYKKHIEAVSGFEQFLTALKDSRILTGIATSAPRANMDLIVEGLRLNGSMESMLASEDVMRHKPDPEIYLKSASNLGIQPENCVVFEDSFSGITAAKAAGMKVVGVLTSHSKHELPGCKAYIKDFARLALAFVYELVKP